MTGLADTLPNDISTLKSMVIEQTLLIEKLKLQLATLRRVRFGRRSEALETAIDQLELMLEEMEVSQRQDAPHSGEDTVGQDSVARPVRRPLPPHLPREDILHMPEATCTRCGGTMRKLGEDVTEVLEFVPARFKVIRHVRPKLSCRSCESIVQQALPSLPIERGRPGPSLLAHVLVSKYADHLPLYRQSRIYAREEVELNRSTLADWVGQSTALMAPLVEAIGSHVLNGEAIHADDTPVKVLAPGCGKTKTGRLWVYLRDEGDYAGPAPPAAFYRYSPDRKGVRPRRHLKDYAGHLHADGYAGFEALYRSGKITEVACLAHVRRKFFDIHAANGSPLAKQALERIGALYAVEKDIRGKSLDQRRAVRRARSAPLFDDLERWLRAQLASLSSKSALAGAIRYGLSRLKSLRVYLDDGRLSIDNNHAERAVRGIAVGRKNWLFAGSDAGGERAAAAFTLTETAKLNGLNPQAYLAHVLTNIADHPINKINDLLPWNVRLEG